MRVNTPHICNSGQQVVQQASRISMDMNDLCRGLLHYLPQSRREAQVDYRLRQNPSSRDTVTDRCATQHPGAYPNLPQSPFELWRVVDGNDRLVEIWTSLTKQVNEQRFSAPEGHRRDDMQDLHRTDSTTSGSLREWSFEP